MTKKCIICKVEQSRTSISKCSFHKFPKDAVKQKKWCEALNIKTNINFNTALVCSNHFEITSFVTLSAEMQKKKLTQDAIPFIEKPPMLVSTLVPTKSNTIIHITQNSIDAPTAMSQNLIDTASATSQNPVTATSQNPTDTATDINKQKSNSKISKLSLTGTNPRQKIKFVVGCRTDYIQRSDFISDKAWDKFMTFYLSMKRKLSARHSENCRQKKKCNKLLKMVDYLKKNKETTINSLG